MMYDHEHSGQSSRVVGRRTVIAEPEPALPVQRMQQEQRIHPEEPQYNVAQAQSIEQLVLQGRLQAPPCLTLARGLTT